MLSMLQLLYFSVKMYEVCSREFKMIIKSKVHTMTKLAMLEGSIDGNKMLKTMGFFRTDFIRWEILKTIASVTIGYVIILALITMYNSEYVVKNATKLNYKAIGFKVLGIYLILLIIYSVITFFLSVYKYEKNKKKFIGYNGMLAKLEKFYEKPKEDTK